MDVRSALIRQKKAMELLLALMREEYEALMQNQPQTVSSLEFSVHELLQQLFQEKEEVVKWVRSQGFNGLKEYASSLEDEQEQQVYQELFAALKRQEERISAQAVKNVNMAQALAEQSSNLARYFFEQVTPKQEPTYSAQGAYSHKADQNSVLIRGRL